MHAVRDWDQPLSLQGPISAKFAEPSEHKISICLISTPALLSLRVHFMFLKHSCLVFLRRNKFQAVSSDMCCNFYTKFAFEVQCQGFWRSSVDINKFKVEALIYMPGNSQPNGKPSAISTPNASSKPGSNLEAPAAASGRLSVTARRAQFQSSRRIMSAPIRPMNIEDIKNKKKVRKKKVIR